MRFRTEYTPAPAARPLDPARPLALLGSCFTDSVGARMLQCRWQVWPNDCGVLYNPASIAGAVRLALCHAGDEEALGATLAERDGRWASWAMDSHAASSSRSRSLQLLSERLAALRAHLAEAQALIVTFGTAWVYELADRPGYVVANCHKYPAACFGRRRLSVDEIAGMWRDTAALLRGFNPGLRLIFTVSPIRHLKDGFEGNKVSKATLLLACDELCRTVGDAEYFGAYEILNDDLRDYRFYAADMLHPSAQAVEYIWQKFGDRYLTDAGRARLAEGERQTRREAHRPIVTGF